MRSSKLKVSIIGAGNVGSTFAFALMVSGITRKITIVDRNDKKAQGECMDLNHGMSFTRPATICSAGYEGCADSDIVVITAGAKQKPGQTRTDLVQTNADICLSLPSILTRNGVEQFLRIELSPEEQSQFKHSADTLKINGNYDFWLRY